MFSNNEYRIGAFSGVVAAILVLALTAMAFVALEPPHETSHASWEVAAPEPIAPAIIPSSPSYDS